MTKRIGLIAVAAVLLGVSALVIGGQPLIESDRSFSLFDTPFGGTASVLSSTPAATSPLPSALSLTTAPVYDLFIPTASAQSRAGQEFLKFLDEQPFFSYSPGDWQSMRREAEGYPAPEQNVAASTGAPAVQTPLPPPVPSGLAVDLPYESQLSISGRKLIGVNFKSTMYDAPEAGRRTNSSTFDMSQELQVRIKGRVGRKINVNVDFDDTREDKRDISVSYKGDPDEFVQEAAFGDIAMSLPSTEFVGYSRQLFGVKLDTKYKGLHTQGFFSRTKGLSEVKRFVGNTSLVRKTIPDNGYIKLKYFSILFSDADRIVPGSARIYRDDRNPNNNQVTTASMTVTSITGSVSYSGAFDQLVPNQDYIVDYERGILWVRNNIESNWVIAVDYDLAGGGALRARSPGAAAILVKDMDNSPGVTRELRTFYNLGSVKIVRDNGRGNFILRVIRKNGETATEIPQYPDNITVDFEAGIFNFNPSTGTPFPSSTYPTEFKNNYDILTEYRYRLKIISLRPGIIPQSERVTLDGRQLKVNDDYFIDYDAGILTFYNEEQINESTVIEVSYDYAPFGGTGGSTLVGVRSELSLTNDLFIGSSFIYDFAARTQTLPDIRTTPASLMVWEGDSRIQNIKMPVLPLTMNVSGEYAMSQRNPNIMGKAIIESMEGIRQEDSVSLFSDAWQYAATPQYAGAPDSGRYFSQSLSWSNSQVKRTAINPNLVTTTADDEQQVLNISYDLVKSTEVALVQSLSTVGVDYSKKLYLEAWIRRGGGNDKPVKVSIDYGSFNENADKTLPAGQTPRTEDTNPRDGALSSGEDVGWEFFNPDGSSVMVGRGNGRLDTEDLDRDGNLRTSDMNANNAPFTISLAGSTWTYVYIPLEIANPSQWEAVKQVRLTIDRDPDPASGTIQLAGLTLISNRWETVPAAVNTATVTIAAINREISPEYKQHPLVNRPEYQDLYEIQSTDNLDERVEQALNLNYSLDGNTTFYVDLATRLPYTRSYDLSSYERFRLFVYRPNFPAPTPDDSFFIQVGNDTNYFEYVTSITWSNEWKLITIYQYDANGDKKPDFWAVTPGGAMNGDNAYTRVVGAPSLQNISQIKLGVRTAQGGQRQIWVNEIHAMDSYTKNGVAWRGNVDFTWPSWSTFGVRRKSVDRNFETFSAGIYNRDFLEDSAYFNFNRMTFLPISTKISRVRTVTPAVVQTQNELVSILDEGRKIEYNGTGSANLNLNDLRVGGWNLGRWLPQLGGSYNRSIIDTQEISRLEDRETVAGTLNYTPPVRFALLPTSVSGGYSVSNSFFRVYPSSKVIDSDTFLDLNTLGGYLDKADYHTLEISEAWNAKTPFQFWSGFTLTPGYSLTTVHEKNRLFPKPIDYPKSLTQDANASSQINIFKWLQPGITYAINTRENYAIAYNTTTLLYPAQNKYIERNSNGEITWNFQARDIIANRYLSSLGISSSYRIQDTDSYDNVPSSFNVLGIDKMWIRGNQLSQATTAAFTLRSVVRRDDIRLSGRYNPFEAFSLSGRLAALRTVAANFTYTQNEEVSNILSNQKNVSTRIWPDLLVSLNQFEKLVYLDRWLSESQTNLRVQNKHSLTAGIARNENSTYGGDFRFNVVKKLDLTLSFNTNVTEDFELVRNIRTQQGLNQSWAGQTGFNMGPWRLTLRYENSQNQARDSTGKLTTDLLTNSISGQVYSDFSFARGIPLPFSNRTLPLTNRIILNSTARLSVKNSALNYERDNTNNFTLNATADYEVSQNFRLSVGLGYSRLYNRVKTDESYSTIEASSRLTIQF